MPLAAIDGRFRPRRDRRPRRGDRRAGHRSVRGRAFRLPRRPSATIPGNSSTCCSATARCTRMSCCTTSSFPTSLAKAFGGPRHGLARVAAAGRRAGTRLDLLGAQAAGPAAGRARGARPRLRARRHRLHQGRSRARRPGLFAVRGARRGDRGALRARGAAGARALRAEPVGRSRRHAAADRRRRATPASIPCMIAPMIMGFVELPPAGAGEPGHRLHRPSDHGWGGADRPAAPPRQAVPPDRRRRRGVPQPWRTLRLLPRYMPGDRARGAGGMATGCGPACRFRPAG